MSCYVADPLKVGVTIRFSKTNHVRLAKLCQERRVTTAKLVREIVVDYLNNQSGHTKKLEQQEAASWLLYS